jgi:hypothetical protein
MYTHVSKYKNDKIKFKKEKKFFKNFKINKKEKTKLPKNQ